MDGEYRPRDFEKAFRTAQIQADRLRLTEVSADCGIPYATLWKRIHHPHTITVEDFRKILRVVPIKPEDALALLGYSPKECKKEGLEYGNNQD